MIVVNPGDKICRICGSLVTGPTIFRNGSFWKHEKCVKRPKGHNIRRVRGKGRNLGYLND